MGSSLASLFETYSHHRHSHGNRLGGALGPACAQPASKSCARPLDLQAPKLFKIFEGLSALPWPSDVPDSESRPLLHAVPLRQCVSGRAA